MFTFLLKRLGLVLPTFIGITLLVFSLIRLIPGDPVEALSGERGMTPERYQRLIHEFGLDRPLAVQYGEYVWRALHGDLGISVVTDVCLPDALKPVSLAEIVATANVAEKKLRRLVRRVVAAL